MKKEEIREKLLDGTIEALSIDTCVFDQAGHKLEQGNFKQLEQFCSGSFRLVFPEITLREFSAHLAQKTEEALSSLKKGLADMGNYWLTPEDQRAKVLSQLTGTNDHLTKTSERLNSFLKRCNAETIQAQGNVDVGTLVNRYFSLQAPFESKKEKKNEFPDAIALMTLESWAANHNTAVLLVTKDKGCQEYCDGSPHLAAIDDLNEALSLIQERDKHRAELCDSIMKLIQDGGYPNLEGQIHKEISDQIYSIDWYPEAYSNFYYDPEMGDVEVLHVEILAKKKLRPVSFQARILVARLSVDVVVRATCHFRFSTRDHVDRDMVSIGSADVQSRQQIPLDVLITFENPEGPAPPSIVEMELVPSRREINFGEVGPDYSDENPYHEKY
ncbi:DUF4935 domain-containing protein [Pusillimonas sp. TS35]|nr:DUF4935 domain-containing protein [Pusillimonas sp. TS35]